MFDQPIPLGELYVRWVGGEADGVSHEIDEFDSTIDEFDVKEVQDFRDAADWVTGDAD
jgi:hypothetical protein